MGNPHSTDTQTAEDKGRRLAEEVSTEKSSDPAREGKRKVDLTAEEQGRKLAREVPSGVGRERSPKR